MMQILQGRQTFADLVMSTVAHVAGWEVVHLHDLGRFSWVESVLHRSCTAPQNGRLVSTGIFYVDSDLSDLCSFFGWVSNQGAARLMPTRYRIYTED